VTGIKFFGAPDFTPHSIAPLYSTTTITYELLGLVIERSNDIVSLFKVLENIRIDALFLSRKDGVKLKIQEGSLAYCGPKRTGVLA
jgi:hypothetical protein